MSRIQSEGLSQDLVFEVLKSPRRRYVLYYLRKQRGWVSLSEVTEQVAAWENDVTQDELSGDQRKRVYISLYQTHLPKLDEAGLVDYDQDRGAVALSDRADELDDYLGERSTPSFPWEKYYLALSFVSTALVLGVWLGIPPLSRLSALGTAFVVLTLFAISALVQHVHYTQQNTPELPPELRRTKT